MAFVLKSILSDMSIAISLSCLFYLHEIPFSIPLLSVCVCLLSWSESLVGSILQGLVFNPISHSVSMIRAFSPLTFKVIIERYVLIVILNLVLQLILWFFVHVFFFVFPFVVWWFFKYYVWVSFFLVFVNLFYVFNLWSPWFSSMLTHNYIYLL